MYEKVITQVKLEIRQIDRLLSVYSGLLSRLKKETPDTVEVAAVASILHSFYNGVEKIFLSVAKGIDQEVPMGSQWHRELLVRMSKKAKKRQAVISPELAEKLSDYLGFRHFFRHSYSFFLEWDELKNLVIPLQEIWMLAKDQLNDFVKNLAISESKTPERH